MFDFFVYCQCNYFQFIIIVFAHFALSTLYPLNDFFDQFGQFGNFGDFELDRDQSRSSYFHPTSYSIDLIIGGYHDAFYLLLHFNQYYHYQHL